MSSRQRARCCHAAALLGPGSCRGLWGTAAVSSCGDKVSSLDAAGFPKKESRCLLVFFKGDLLFIYLNGSITERGREREVS